MMRRNTIIILFISSALALLIFVRVIDFNGLYGQDAHEYLRYARALNANAHTAHASLYYPPLYPIAGAVLGYIMDIRLALQLISIVSFIITLFLVYKSIQKIFPINTYALVFTLCIGFLSPYFFRISVCVMSDSLACVLLMSSIYFGISYYQSNKAKHFLIAILFAALCVITRLAVIVPLALMFLQLVLFKRKEIYRSVPLKLLLSVAIVAMILLLYKAYTSSSLLQHPLFAQISTYNFFRRSFSSGDGVHAYTIPNALFMLYPFFYPGFLFLGVLCAFLFKKEVFQKKEIQLALIPSIGYLFFLGFLPTQNVRLQTLVFPLLLLMYYPAFDRLMTMVKYKRAFIVVIIVLQLTMIGYALKPIYNMSKVERQIATRLKTYQTHYHSLYELGCEGVLSSYNIDIQPTSLYADTLRHVNDSSLLLIQDKAFEKQWAGQKAGQNFAFIEANAVRCLCDSFPDGWNLYTLSATH